MQRLRNLWQDTRLTEYLLIAAYSAIAILSLIVGITAKTGTLFARAAEETNRAAKPELKSILQQLALASADFGVGLSLLVVAGLIVYWSGRGKKTQRETIGSTLPAGPPFLL